MKKIYSYDEKFFEEINSEEKAYFLGVMYADGCVRKNKSKVCKNIQYTVSLGMLDLEVIENFKKCLNGDFPIKQRILKNGKIFNHVILTSEKMVKDLEAQGCVERKSLVLKFPEMDEKYLYDFIRGYFDGDGSIFQSTQRVKRNDALFIYHRPSVHICGTLEFINDLCKILQLSEKCIKKEKRRVSNSWYIRVDGYSQVEKIYNLLYADKKIYLSRKKDKFLSIFKQRGSETIIGTPTRGKYKVG